jgi:hypothetical protein
MISLYLLRLGQGWPNARGPQTPEEWWLCGLLVCVGVALAAGLMRPLVRAAWLLEQSKKSRGERGWALLERMISPTRLPVGRTMGLSLRGQDLRGMDLQDAFLADVDLSDTDLRGVDLSGANLSGAHLLGARYDAQTRWPEGFDPRASGAILVR